MTTAAHEPVAPGPRLDRYRALFDNASDMVVLIAREADGGYRCLEANDAVARMEGIPLDVIVGKRVDAIHPPHVYAEWKAIYDRALDLDGPLDVDHEVPSPLGPRLRRTRFLSLGPDGDGRDLLLGICQDLTDAHRARAEQEDFARYRSAMHRLNAILDGDRPEEEVLRESVDAIREVFACDRCLLSFPCEPDTAEVTIPFHADRPGSDYPPFPAVLPVANAAVRAALETFERTQEPMSLGPQEVSGFGKAVLERHYVRSRLVTIIRPRTGQAWCLALQQCDSERVWTPSEKLLFKDLSARIKSALDALLLTRTLRRSEAFHNLLTEGMPQLLWTSRADGTVEFVNRRLREYTGLDDLVGRLQHFEHVHPEDMEANRENWSACAGAGKAFEAEMRLRRRDGEYRWHLVRAEPILDPDGTIGRWVGTCTDISESKRLQADLEHSKEQLEAIIGGVDEGISAQDPTGRIVYANRKYAWISGFDSPEELMAAPLAERMDRYAMFDEEGRPVGFDRLPGRLALQNGSQASMNLRFLDRKLGRELWLSLKSTAVRDGRGRVAMAINFSQDITEARRSREELVRSREQLAAILSGIADSIIAQTPEGRMVYANDAAAKLLGFPSPAALMEAADRALASGTPNPMVFADEEGRPVPVDELPSRLAREGVQPPPAILRFRMHPGAKERWVISQAKPLFDPDGRVALVLAMAQDITELREKEEAVRRLQKMDSLGKLAGGIAHDFNNLLVSINGYGGLGMAATRESAPLLHEYFSEILQSGQRAAALTQQLLAYGRKQIVRPRTLDLNAVVADMQKLLRRLIGEDIEVRMELAEGLPGVKGDASQLEQVVMNLVLNARDAMPGGGVLTLETAAAMVEERDRLGTPEANPGRHVVLTVADTGTGIDPAIRDRIFDPFFTTKETGKGTGLGLASVYGIVTQWGGHITVESRPGAGATFRVLLPALPEASPAPPAVAPAGREPASILLVEDEPSVLRFAAHTLEKAGYRVLRARDAEEAAALAGKEEVELLITDVVMPGARGTELLRKLRGLRPGLKAVLMSGYIDPQGKEAIEYGKTEFLQKPFPPDSLLLKVGRLLAGETAPPR